MSIVALVPVLAALAGAFIGGLVAEVRTVLEMRRERRQGLNRVLWTQLDLWYDLERSEVGGVVDHMHEGLAKRLGVAKEDLSFPAEYQDLLGSIIAQLASDARNPELDSQYETAVDALASFDPILAFRLSGKTKLARPREQSEGFIATVVQQMGSISYEELKPGVDHMRPFVRGEMFESSRQIFREDIEEVAEQLGRKAKKRVRRLLSNLSLRAGQQQETILEDYLDRAAPQLVALAAALQSSSNTATPEPAVADVPEGQ